MEERMNIDERYKYIRMVQSLYRKAKAKGEVAAAERYAADDRTASEACDSAHERSATASKEAASATGAKVWRHQAGELPHPS